MAKKKSAVSCNQCTYYRYISYSYTRAMHEYGSEGDEHIYSSTRYTA